MVMSLILYQSSNCGKLDALNMFATGTQLVVLLVPEMLSEEFILLMGNLMCMMMAEYQRRLEEARAQEAARQMALERMFGAPQDRAEDIISLEALRRAR